MSGARAAAPRGLRALARRLPRPRPRLLLLVGVLAAVTTLGWLWLRDSSLVSVEQVTITGSTSNEEQDIRSALTRAARDMTTLHVREDQLRTAVEPYRSVAELEVDPTLPHKLSIRVIQHRPVATLLIDGSRVPASGDGLLLRGVRPGDGMPEVKVERAPGGPRIGDRKVLAALAVAGAAPEPLLKRSLRIWWGDRGMTLDLRDGPDLIFGSRDDAATKWAAAARVLADPAAVGATYLDLRVPERVAAGGLGEVSEEEDQAGGEQAPGTGAGQPPPAAGETVPPAATPEPQATPSPAVP
jgi:cell division protein FtsQ